MELYIQIDKIKGEVTESAHKEWIKIHNYSFGVQSEGVEDPSARGKLVSAAGNYSPIVFHKTTDITSPMLQQLASEGTHIAKVTIHACLDNSAKVPANEIELTDVVISGYAMSASEGGDPSETVELRYAKIKVTSRNFDEKGQKKTEPSFTWDLTQKKKA